MGYRPLGKTGLKVSAVSFGVGGLRDAGVLTEALQMGVNYFDTAHGYQNGKNEEMLESFFRVDLQKGQINV